MKKSFKVFFGLVLALASVIDAQAQATFPTKTVQLVVPFAVGGSTDRFARLIAEKLGERWKQAVVVENWVGGNGIVGSGRAARAKADGYSILMGTVTTHAVAQSLYPNLTYSVERDFVPVTELATIPQLLSVRPSLPVHTVREFLAYAKSHPGDLTYLGGTGQAASMSMALLASRSNVKMLEVPYIGSAQGMTALIAEQIDSAFDVIMTSLPILKSGRIRTLAVTSTKRSPLLPNIPTVAESGLPGFDSDVWFGLFVPVGTPADVVKKISEDSRAVLNDPKTKDSLESSGFDVVASSSADFSEKVRGDIQKWRKVIKDAGIKAE